MSSSKLSRVFHQLRYSRLKYRLSSPCFNIHATNSYSLYTVNVAQRDCSSWNAGQEEHTSRSSYLSVGLCLGIGILYAWRAFPSVEAKEVPSEASQSDPEIEHVSKLYEQEIEARNTKEIGLLNQREKFNFIANVVETTAPAVVYIEIKDVGRRNYFGGSQTFSNGSGFVIKEDGLILTNAHVVIGRPHSIVQVKLQDGRIFQGQVEDIDTVSDLATVRIPCNNLPTLKLGNSSTVKPGEFVVAMGSPLSLANTITSGVVSSVNRGSYELGLRGRDMEYIQTDAAITFGNSGGPLVNLDGEAIGINAMKVTAGISFAIPIDYAKEFLLAQEKRKEQGTGWLGSWMGRKATESRSPGSPRSPVQPQRRFMGVTLLTLTPQLILELQMRGTDLASDVYNGVLVWKVVLGSPAHSAGLQPGDVIVSINGHPISTSKDVYKELEGRDEILKLGIVRKRQHLTIEVRPEDSS